MQSFVMYVHDQDLRGGLGSCWCEGGNLPEIDASQGNIQAGAAEFIKNIAVSKTQNEVSSRAIAMGFREKRLIFLDPYPRE